jgi:hypothetical protein
MPENAPPKKRVGLVLCRPYWDDTGPARHARAGFLEGKAIETPLPIGLKTSNQLRRGGDTQTPVQANSAVGLLGQHFKKTAPFELICNGRLHADTKFGHLFCRIW